MLKRVVGQSIHYLLTISLILPGNSGVPLFGGLHCARFWDTGVLGDTLRMMGYGRLESFFSAF